MGLWVFGGLILGGFYVFKYGFFFLGFLPYVGHLKSGNLGRKFFFKNSIGEPRFFRKLHFSDGGKPTGLKKRGSPMEFLEFFTL